MRKILFLTLFISIFCYSQNNFVREYSIPDSLIQNNEIENDYLNLQQLELQISQSDSLPINVLWYQIQIVSFLESEHRMNQDFENSLRYGMEALDLIRKGKIFFDNDFADREAFMINNIIISNVGLGRYDIASKYKKMLYKKYKEGTLPEGIDEYFNFDYFKWGDKNIWGYEWYAELPEDRFSSSFTKVVYYIYSTNPDGSDNEQLYRLHVLMFHASNAKFDYIMTKYVNTPEGEIRFTMHAYTYKEDIDFEKLHNDIIRVLEGKAQSDFEEMLNKK